MSVELQEQRVRYIGNGTAKTFAFPFQIEEPGQVQVVQAREGGDEVTLALGTDYSVALNADGTGSVTLASALPTGYVLALLSAIPATQERAFYNNTPYYQDQIEGGLDKNTRLIQQLEERVQRSVKLPATDPRTPEQYAQELFDSHEEVMAMPARLEAQLVSIGDRYVLMLEEKALALINAASAFNGAAVVEIAEDMPEGAVIELPALMQYVVGSNMLMLFYNGTTSYEGQQYREVGKLGDTSRTVTMLHELRAGDMLQFRVIALHDYDVTAKGSTTPRNLSERFADVVNVKDFGAKGDGVTDDTAAIQAALDACIGHQRGGKKAGKQLWFDPAGEYRITGPLKTDNNISCSSRILFKLDYTPTNDDTQINLNGYNDIAHIRVEVVGENNFQRILRVGAGHFGSVEVVAENFSTATPTAASVAAVSLSYDDHTYIENLYVLNCWNGAYVRYSNYVHINKATFENCVRGIQIYNSDYFTLDNVFFYGKWLLDASNSNWDEVSSGANAIVLQNVKNALFGMSQIHQTMSHGIRISGESDEATSKIHFGTVAIYQAGRCGVKVCGSTVDEKGGYTATPARIISVTFDQIYVEDCAKTTDNYLKTVSGGASFSDYNGNGKYGGTNEYGLRLDNVRLCYIGKFTIKKKTNRYASTSAGIRVKSCQEININNIEISDAYYYGIFLDNGYNLSTYNNIKMDGLILDVGTPDDNTSADSRGHAVYFGDSFENCSDVYINVRMVNTRRGLRTAFTGFPMVSIFSGYSAKNWKDYDIEGSLTSLNCINDIVAVANRI